MSLSNYIQRLALVLRKSIKHQWGKVISAKEITTKEDLQNLKRAKDISEFWLLPRHLYNKTKFKERCHELIERSVVLTKSRRVTAALIAKYVNRAKSLFTGAHAFFIRLSYHNSYSVAIFCIIFDIIL